MNQELDKAIALYQEGLNNIMKPIWDAIFDAAGKGKDSHVFKLESCEPHIIDKIISILKNKKFAIEMVSDTEFEVWGWAYENPQLDLF